MYNKVKKNCLNHSPSLRQAAFKAAFLCEKWVFFFVKLNLSVAFLERCVKDVCLMLVYIEKQWKSSTVKWKITFYVNSPYECGAIDVVQ